MILNLHIVHLMLDTAMDQRSTEECYDPNIVYCRHPRGLFKIRQDDLFFDEALLHKVIDLKHQR